ncbi:Mu transposase C-terminal domain-containing protein [Streptomyces sp. NBC_01715]|uniref:transposase family protein n=1 Tax=Streptomyces sp. NBC_01715 TaxID=2975916 RepID=UPI002E3723C2|nr:transposase family protein [Streptomyces sp. NBC_01715]
MHAEPDPPPDAQDTARRRREREELMGPAVRALLQLAERGELSTAHVELSAHTLGVHVRTVWRNLARARSGELLRRTRQRFEVDDEIRVLLAYYRGNVKRVHEELERDAEKAGCEPVSLSTLHRAIRRDLTPGDRAGLRAGLPASRSHDPHLRRPPTTRNEEWEGDHKQAPVWVWAEGRLVKPWVTWFCDCHTGMIMGWAVTPHYPHRGSILAALRACILRTGTHGPAGGLPTRIRIDRGKDFLSNAVKEALGAFAVHVDVLPPYTPHLKGSIENLNHTATTRLFSTLPRYTGAQKLNTRRRSGEKDPALTFESFTDRFAAWVTTHNAEHPKAAHGELTALEWWNNDPTPLREVPAADLHAFLLESDRSTRVITGHGIRFKGRDYMAGWMTGRSGTRVHIRFQPHQLEEIHVFDADNRHHLGTAYLADQASEEQIDEVYRARGDRARRLRRDLRRAEALRRRRFKPSTTAGPARTTEVMTRKQVTSELRSQRSSRHDDDLPANYMPRRITPSSRWAVPDAAPTPPEENR